MKTDQVLKSTQCITSNSSIFSQESKTFLEGFNICPAL